MRLIKTIAEEYANSGFEILQKELYSEKPGTLIKYFEEKLTDLI